VAGGQVAYGKAHRGDAVQVWANASQPWQGEGGKWVHLATASRLATLSSGTNTSDLFGWANVGTYSSSSIAGQDWISVCIERDAVYEMPINATQTLSQLRYLQGKTCDIILTSGIQYANYAASTDQTLEIVGYKYYDSTKQTLLVRRYLNTISATEVA